MTAFDGSYVIAGVVWAPGVRGVSEHARREEMRVAVPDPGHLQTDTVQWHSAMCLSLWTKKPAP